MPNSAFTMSYNEHTGTTVPLPRRDIQLELPPGSLYDNGSLSPSPDSSSSVSTRSDREASSSPDINMLDRCITEGFLLNSLQGTALLQQNLFGDTSMSLSQTCITTSLGDHVNFDNKNLSSQGNQETQEYCSFSRSKGNVSDKKVTSPDSAGTGEEGQISSCESSRHGSAENDCFSMSSGEMVIRSNSFCLADQSLLVFSSLDESSISPVTALAEFQNEAKILTTPTLPDVCENVAEVKTEHSYLGMTFTLADHWELPEEDNLSAATSPVVLPGGTQGGLFMTFLCEASPDDKPVQLTSMEAAVAPYSAAFTPEKGTTFVPNLSPMHDLNKDSQTSTPVPNTGIKILPSLSESPCTKSTGSPRLLPAEKQRKSVTSTNLAMGLSQPASKVNKIEIKKCPKSDLSNAKSKVVARTVGSGSSLQQKQLQANLHSKHIEAPIGTKSRKGIHTNAFVSATDKRENNAQKQVNPRGAPLGVTIIQSPEDSAGNGKCNSSISTTASETAQTACFSTVSSENEQTASCQVVDIPSHCTGNQNVSLSSFETSPDKSVQKDLKRTPKKHTSNKIEVKSSSTLSCVKTRPRCSSESLPCSSRTPKERITTTKFSNNITFPRNEKQTKPRTLSNSSQSKLTSLAEGTKRAVGNSTREVNKISLVTESGRAPGSSLDQTKSRARGQTFPRQSRGTSLSHLPTASPRPASQSVRQRQVTSSRVDFRMPKSVGTPQSTQNSIAAGSQRAQATGEQSLEAASSASVKPQLNGSRLPQTPTRSSLMGPPPTPTSRLPRKTPVPSRSQNGGSVGRDRASGGAGRKQTTVKTVGLKARLLPNPGKSNGPIVSDSARKCSPVMPSTSTPAPITSKGSCTSTASPLKRSASSRLVNLTPSRPVDNNNPKAGCRQQPPLQQVSTSQSKQNNGRPDVVPPSVKQGDRKDQRIQHLTELLASSNCRFEAVTVVLQQTLAERDESMGRCKELSQELVSLRGELVCSVNSSERLEKEKQDLQNALDNAMQRLKEQHQQDLEEVEQRLQVFYQAECDKVHLSYQEEADKCKALLQQQMAELECSQNAVKLELEHSHIEQLQCAKQQHEQSLLELGNIHNQQLESLSASLKATEATLSAQIEELTQQNAAMMEKLTAEENKRMELVESQKDSHTVYLEQELESLKVVLDIKNKQLHQREKKMMDVDKLVEKNVKLDESLKRVQQENEDLKARIERHATLWRQLSTEQAMLQESLQKESKVNKRLSMENEELLWKLHNGDLSSPHKVSPTSMSPSHSFSLQSPRSPGTCSPPPLSPR
ncbi:microtubule-associated tumor suppressor 1 homolog A isoform X2 [Dunckerocampus dactyliophorus]|uniref:microtubule-associated tumor suppressor 1 homolog A isoform X2 n=1 Tax=Dunckerocampus dactyliophorus TaxID=161453 RepID=UPI0024060F08|nr:microtubule-associated tumor suppressor 1 homolog A isoform X2 [Dunckerocampus dactyliophorus]